MSDVFDIPIARTRIGLGARVTLDPAAVPPDPAPRDEVLRLARKLALAHEMQRMIDDGEVNDQADLARMLGFTRARVTQILDLTLLAPDIQESILGGSERDPRSSDGHALRRLTGMPWRRQRAVWANR